MCFKTLHAKCFDGDPLWLLSGTNRLLFLSKCTAAMVISRCFKVIYSELFLHLPDDSTVKINILVFQNEEIFVQLDELDKLDRIIHACIGFNYNFTQVQKIF